MSVEHYRVLVVEDDPSDAALLNDALSKYERCDFETCVVETLADAVDAIKEQKFDAILLDLALPDSAGIETIQELADLKTDIPIIVSSGSGEDDFDLSWVSVGASDFISKQELNSSLVGRAITFAIERSRLHMQLNDMQRSAAALSEMANLTAISESGSSTETAKSFGIGPLKLTAPDQFERLKDIYVSALSDAVTAKQYKVERQASEKLAEIAAMFGRLRCGPRDIIDLHISVMDAGSENQNATMSKEEAEEARYLLVELLGKLVTFYRSTAAF